MHRHRNLERQLVCRSHAVPEDEFRDEPARDALAIFNGYVTALDRRVLLPVTLEIAASAAAEDGDKCLDQDQ